MVNDRLKRGESEKGEKSWNAESTYFQSVLHKGVKHTISKRSRTLRTNMEKMKEASC